MDNSEKIDFVGVVKQEPDDHLDYDVANVIEQEYHYKQEPDVEWNEYTFILDDLKKKYTFSNEPAIHIFHAKVFVERLPESILEKYGAVERKPIVTEIPKINQSTGRITRKFLGLYQKVCPKCSKITLTNTKHSARKCLKCSIRLRFECKRCNTQTACFATMKYHLIVKCNPNGHYQCLVCRYVSMSKRDLKEHMRMYHPTHDEARSIKKCDENSNREHSGENQPHKCQTCGYQFRSRKKFLWHTQSCGDTKRIIETRKVVEKMCTYSCKDCNDTMTKFESAEECTLKKCNRCGCALSRRCIKCPKVFSTLYGFYHHFKTIHDTTDRDIFACPECEFEARAFNNLLLHYKNKHQPASPKCTNHKSSLLTHIRFAHKIKNSIGCPSCGRKYKNQGSFHDHLRYCGKAPYFQCDKCPFKTSYKSALVRHKYTKHPDGTMSKDFACTKCEKVFQNDTARKVHEYYHRKKQLCCNDCLFKTTTRKDIVAHLKSMHLEQKDRPPLEVCSDCGTKVKSKFYLKLHSRYCVTKPYYECDHCIYKTQKRKEFKTHLSWMHSEIGCFQSASNLDSQVDVTN